MAIEVRCPSCNCTLRVADEQAGKQLRCPACQQVSVAPAEGAAVEPAHDPARWHMRTPDGQVFGPVTWLQLQQWMVAGRIAADCQIAGSMSGPWRGAAECFPALQAAEAGPAVQQPPVRLDWAPRDTAAEVDWSAAVGAAPGLAPGKRYVKPHRGGLILVLGILGIAINCPVFCFMAWVMGSSDLAEMQVGRMDPSGEQLTQIGQVLGKVWSLVWIVGGLLVVVVLLISALAGL